MSVMLHLFHGRDSVEQDMDDWGYDGPTLGPFKYVHVTYVSDLKFAMELEAYRSAFPEDTNPHVNWEIGPDGKPIGWVDGRIPTESDLIPYQGKFYGDFSVFQVELTSPEKAAPDLLAALKLVAPLWPLESIPVGAEHLPYAKTARAVHDAIAKAGG